MLILHDKRIPDEYLSALKEKLPGLTLIPFGGIPGKVYDSISCHPDIYFFRLDEKTLIHAPGLTVEYLAPLKEHGLELVKGEGDPEGRYPVTARYNAARAGKVVFHNTRHTDPGVLRKVRESGLETACVEQGYARCSVIEVSKRAIITADDGIAGAAAERGLDVLTVSSGSVLLPGEKYGFIGGATGPVRKSFSNGTSLGKTGRELIFLGDPYSHPDGPAIMDFLRKYGVRAVYPEGLALYDAGGLMVF